jgi:hypothetical protein
LTLFGRLSQLPKRWRAWIAGAVVLVLIILFFPFQSTTVPRWRVQVVDETGAMVPNISVTEHWQHYLLESDGHEEMRQTNATGVADFPARTVRASVSIRVIDFIINSVKGGARAKVDPYGSLVVWGSRDHETAVAICKPGTPTQTTVVVHRR